MKFAPLNNLGHVGLAIFLFGWKSVDAAAPYWDSWFSSGEESEEKPDGFLVESPIINRRLEASVQTDWPSSPHNVLCEAFSFLKSDYDFLDRLAAQLQSGEVTPVDSYERAYQLVEKLQPNRPLLQYALRMRAQSPHCELQRGLAQQQLMEHQEAKPLNIFAVVNGRVWASKPDWNQIASTGQQDSNSTLLPGETMHPSSKEDGPLVLLYGNLGSTEFAQWYSELMASNCCRVVVRHFGASATNTVALQGYGVRLDIRNVEYKVFDDVKSSVSTTDELFNVSALDHVGSTNYLAGVNISQLMAGSSSQTMLDVQERLWKWHERQQHHSQIIPPRWQRRQLPLQAATVMAESTQIDRLLVFQDVAQNLPRVASTLVHVKIDPDVESWASAMEQSGFSPQRRSFLYVNGIPWNLKGPTVNVFEFLNLLQEEEEKIGALQSRLSPVLPSGEALSKVQEAWMEGSDFWASGDGDDSNDNESSLRIDVARGGKKAILYINDIEKDAQYAHWSSSLQQFLMSMQFGMPPSVRRNLFTVLAVMDPLATDPNVGVNLGLQLTKNSFPLRIGLILVGEKDLESCAEWMSQPRDDDDEPCPVDPFVWHTNDQALALATLEDVPASAHAAFKLFATIVSEFSKEMDNPADAYLEYWTPTLESHQRRNGGTITMKTLVSVHAELLDGMELMSHDEAVSHALSILGEDDGGNTDLTYGHALKFAVQKGVQPGMSFLNGRPLPSSSDESAGDKVGELFMQEQSHIFQMIVKREITDRAPRSVYAKLLTGSNVYSKIHPLLTETTETSHLDLQHGFDHQSLLFPTSEESSSTEGACFVLEAVLQLDDRAGIAKAQRVVKIMKSFPSSVGDNEAIHVAFRILPGSVDGVSSAFCPILANAGLLGMDNIEILFDKVHDNEAFTFDEPGALLDLVPDITAEVRQSILSSAPGPCASQRDFIDGLPSKNFVVANGRYYSIEREQLSKEDVEFLLSIDIARTRAVTRLLDEFMSREDPLYYDGVARTAAFLAASNAESKKSRVNVLKEVEDIAEDVNLGENPLTFSWNTDDNDGSLKTRVTAVFDVATEAAQRVGPLLRVIRDDLQYPLTVVLAPKTLIDGDSKVPITSFYRFVADPTFSSEASPPKAVFENLPTNHVLTLRTDVPEPWDVQQKYSIQDTDNLRCGFQSGCSDEESSDPNCFEDIPIQDREYLTKVVYGLNHLLFSGQCYESKGSPPNGLQLTLTRSGSTYEEERLLQDVEIGMDGSASISPPPALPAPVDYADTLVMKNIGYWQLRGNPGVWDLNIAEQSRGSEIFDMVKGTVRRGQIKLEPNSDPIATKTLVMKDFVTRGELLLVKRRPGYEKETLFYDREDRTAPNDDEEVINVFSLATGHLYERFLKIMMLSVTKRTSSKVKFWLFENFLSPTFKASARAMSERIGCEVEFVTYKWPEWLRGQSEKQRIIWGYKILFLDVLFPLNVKKIIYVDADQVVRGDLKELWDMDLHGAPYGYTPFCTSRETTLGFQFWRSGFWESHLRGKPYHISALYVVDLQKFRKTLVGDQLRSIYQQLSADPNSLANLDQDLPNYAQHQVPIFSLPQEWLWCETWCSDETKATAKTIDLCNNPLHKEPKVSMAKRIISGELFNESWVELDAEVEMYDQEYRRSLDSGA